MSCVIGLIARLTHPPPSLTSFGILPVSVNGGWLVLDLPSRLRTYSTLSSSTRRIGSNRRPTAVLRAMQYGSIVRRLADSGRQILLIEGLAARVSRAHPDSGRMRWMKNEAADINNTRQRL